MKNKILFITVAFPPRLSPASLRIFSFAEELERQGHEVFVVTCDQGDDNKFNFNSSISEDNVYRIKYFDIFNFSSFIKNKFITALYKKLISFFISPTGMFYPDLRFLFWRKKALIICSDLIEKHNIDSIYSSFSPGSSHILANQLKKKIPI